MPVSMNSERLRAAIHLLCRAAPAAVLLWAGLTKAFDRQDAILAVDAYDVLPDGAVRAVAAVLPWVEIAVAILLILGLFTRFAGIATLALATVFIAAMGQAKARGLQIDCGCFGGGGAGEGVSWVDILRDIPIALAGLYLAVRPKGPLQLDAYFDSNGTTEDHHGERLGRDDQARAKATQG
jgi:uncharacterized membrane protein YphA (DoxX/SURF4 family)